MDTSGSSLRIARSGRRAENIGAQVVTGHRAGGRPLDRGGKVPAGLFVAERDHVERGGLALGLLRDASQNGTGRRPGATEGFDVVEEVHAANRYRFGYGLSIPFWEFRAEAARATIPVMEANVNRTRNIREWVAQAGGPAAFSRACGGKWVPSQVSQWVSETEPKGIGHALARAIEEAVGRAKGSMDSQPVRLTAATLVAAIGFARKVDQALFGTDDLDPADEHDAELVAQVFNWLAARGISAPSDSDVVAYLSELSRARNEREAGAGTAGGSGGAASTPKARGKGRAAGGGKR